ncbi:MAG: 30S ribosomal protein S3 [Nitrososphaeraceae archaeon]|jgi:small subunit ribosomal protein S3|nr:30S ribosomal protein S3 [Nitrososphaeraceae archaeon]
MSAINNVMKNNFRNLELDEFLSETLRDAGYGRVDVQKTPIGTRITLSVTRPGLVIGRKGTGIKDLTSKLEQKFGLSNPQISVIELEAPELNPKIMCNRIAQLIERGTAFRRAAIWTNNTIMNAGALGVEITVAGKLRSERAHFEKHAVGLVPKSGDVANKVVRYGVTHVLTKMGLMGIQLKIAIKNEMPREFEMIESETSDKSTGDKKIENNVQGEVEDNKTSERNESVEAEGKKNG